MPPGFILLRLPLVANSPAYLDAMFGGEKVSIGKGAVYKWSQGVDASPDAPTVEMVMTLAYAKKRGFPTSMTEQAA